MTAKVQLLAEETAESKRATAQEWKSEEWRPWKLKENRNRWRCLSPWLPTANDPLLRWAEGSSSQSARHQAKKLKKIRQSMTTLWAGRKDPPLPITLFDRLLRLHISSRSSRLILRETKRVENKKLNFLWKQRLLKSVEAKMIARRVQISKTD